MIKGSSSMSSENTGEDGLPPGFRFHPTDEELVTCYLVPKVVDNRFSGRAIAEVDLNKCEPWDLPGKAKMGEKDWYFFSLRDRKYPTGLRTNRATEAGYWKATGKDKEVFKGHNTNYLIGMKKTLVFYRGRAPKGEKTNWVMHEYRLEGHLSYHQLSQNIKDEWVVCRIFHKSSGGKKTIPSLINGNFDIDECLASRSLPALLESPSYSTRGVQNEETEFSDIANIHLCNSNFLQNDPQFNLNTRTANSMSSIFSQISSSESFPGISPPMGFPSNPILMALAEQYSVSELNLKQCKMEPFSSGAKDNSLKFSQAEQWNMGQTRHDHQQQINVDNNGISHTQSMETHGIDPQDHTAMCLNPDQMNPAMFNQVTRSYQLDSSAEAAPTLDLDSLWAY